MRGINLAETPLMQKNNEVLHMAQSATTTELFDTISRFLASPPEGTPVEILDAFSFKDKKTCLPPKIFLETVEQAPIAISITDPHAQILYTNAAFEQLTGYSRDDVVGKNESVLSSQSTPPAVYQDLWKTIQSRNVWRGTLVNNRKNGEEYLAELTISPVLTQQEEIGYFLGMHRDISEVHQLEQRLKFQKILTESALDAAPVVMAMISADRKVLLHNQAYQRLVNDFRNDEPAYLFLEALERELGEELACLCEAQQGKTPVQDKGFSNIEVRIDPPGRSPRWFSCSGVRVHELNEEVHHYFSPDADQRCYLLLVANEITVARQRIQEARMNLIRGSMSEQQMNQTMREAMSAAIFKLQAPLNIIKAALAMPAPHGEQSGLRSVLQQALETGEEAMQSLRHAVPKTKMEQSSLVNLNEVLHEVIQLSTDALLANGVVVDWRPALVLPSIIGQANALRGLFKYLIDNSICAVNEIQSEFREIRLQTSVQEHELRVDIIDNGCGVEENERLKVFEPFFCGWRQTKGHAGMGLSMAREIVMDHNGSIEIDPDFLGGCRICVCLPLAGEETHP